jgi:hypothetical protein
MIIFRIIGLIGSASCALILIVVLYIHGLPDELMEYWFALSVFLTLFNFFPVLGNSYKFSDSLIGLWIESKKTKLKKEIDGD